MALIVGDLNQVPGSVIGELGSVLDAACFFFVGLRDQPVSSVVLPQDLTAGREEDAGDVAVAVVLIFCADKALAAAILVRCLGDLHQTAGGVIVVMDDLRQALAEQASFLGALVQAVIGILNHSAQAVTDPHQAVLLIVAEGQGMDAPIGAVSALQSQETLFCRAFAIAVIGILSQAVLYAAFLRVDHRLALLQQPACGIVLVEGPDPGLVAVPGTIAVRRDLLEQQAAGVVDEPLFYHSVRGSDLNEIICAIVLIGIPGAVVGFRVILLRLNHFNQVPQSIILHAPHAAVRVNGTDAPVIGVVFIADALPALGGGVIGVGVDLHRHAARRVIGRGEHIPQRVGAGDTVVHSVIFVLIAGPIAALFVVLVWHDLGNQVAQQVIAVPGGIAQCVGLHSPCAKRRIAELNHTKHALDGHALLDLVVGILERVALRSHNGRDPAAVLPVCEPGHVPVPIGHGDHAPQAVIGIGADQRPNLVNDLPLLDAIVMGIKSGKVLLTAAAPPVDAVAVFIILIFPDQASGKLLAQQLPILPEQLFGDPAVAVLLQDDIAPLVIRKLLRGAVVIFHLGHQLVLVIVVDDPAAALQVDVNILPVRVAVQEGVFLAVGNILLHNTASLVIAVAEVLDAVLVCYMGNHAMPVILVAHGAAVGIGDGHQVLAVVLIADGAPGPVGDPGDLARLVGEIQVLAAGQGHALDGGAAVVDLCLVPVCIDDGRQAAVLVIIINLVGGILFNLVSVMNFKQLITAVPGSSVDPDAVHTLKLLGIEVILQHCGELAVYDKTHTQAADPAAAQELLVEGLEGLMAAHQPELPVDVWEDEVGLCSFEAAGDRVYRVARFFG